MRIVFMGSAPLSCFSLEALLEEKRHEVAAVVTQPDRPRGRNLKRSPSPVAEAALRAGIPALTPEKVNAPESLAAFRACGPDLIVVVAYGQILKADLLNLPTKGCINVHASLLPKYRGAAPIQWAIVNGEPVTGVTVMQMERRMDAGAIILQREVPIAADDTAGLLHDKLAVAGAELLMEAVKAIADGGVPRQRQDESRATYAPKLAKEDGRIDWTKSAVAINNRIRGFNPWPGCFCHVAAGRPPLTLKVQTARAEAGGGAPGTVLATGGDGPLVATGDGALRLLQVQPEGRKTMAGSAFVRGHRLSKGDRLA